MNYFSPKETLIIIAALVWASILIWFFLVSENTVDVLLVNLLADIPFALFIVWFVEYASDKDRELRSRSRQRAVARGIQKFYQNIVQIITTLIADGVASSPIAVLPEPSLIEARAKQTSTKTLLRSDFSSQPVPYGAYFVAEFTGATPANVYPPRTASAFLVQLAGEHDQLYRDIFQLDDGFLPDNVVDALLELKDLSLNVFCRQVLAMQPATRFGYWPEDELNHATFNLGILQAYFSSKLGYEVSRSEEIVKNAVTNALNRKKQANVTSIGVPRPGANSQT